jgi:hypothetical protein
MKEKAYTITPKSSFATNGFWKNIYSKWLLAGLCIVAVIAGCKKIDEQAGTTGVCPIVISTSPVSNATAVSLSTTVSATFNEAINPASLNAVTFTLRQGTTPIAGVIAYNGTTATFTPTVKLAPNTLYTGTVTMGIKDMASNSPLADYVWNFTTGPDPAPTVTSTDPLNLATAVAFNKKVSFSFSKVMDSTSVVTNFTLINTSIGGTAVTGTIVYTGTTGVFTPTVNLLPSTTYTATITNGAKDPSGIRLVSNYVWSFTTGALPAIISPTVIATDPANSATGVAFNKKVSVTFSNAMDATTITATTFRLANTSAGGTAVSGVVTYAGAIAVFTPLVNLLPNTTYTGTVTTGAKDLAANPLLNNYTWNFTTGAAPDIISPTVISTDPANFATGVALNKTVAANFNKAMDATTITTATFTLANTTLGGTAVVGTVSYSGTTAVFNPIVNLLSSTTYTATITMGAKDLAGNSVVNNYTWSFTTGVAVDAIAPTVIFTDPTNLATNVVLDKKLTAIFSETMDPATINTSTFTLKNGANSITGLVTYTGVVATFSPASNLLPNTTYTATITTSAKDLAGNSLVSNYIWTFTTVIGDIIPPTVVLTDPNDNAIGVALNKKLTATFSEAMDPASINSSTFTLKNGANTITGVVTYSGVTATFSPASNLLPNTTYTATITNSAKDVAGNNLATNYVWTFTTILTDIIPPMVLSTDPLNNATGIALDKKVTATFSEVMDPLTISTLTFTLKNGGTPVTGIVTYLGTTATFTPSANLLASTLYTATITTGAKDVAGNALVSNYTWQYTTVPPVIPPPSLGTMAIFGSFGGNAGVTNQGIFTVINGSIGTTAAATLITGFHDGTTGDIYTETPLNKGLVTGRIHTAPPAPGSATSAAIATLALADAVAAYNSISPASKPGGIDPGAGELGGLTLQPGIYKAAGGTFNITNGPLVLDAKGDANAVWIFQTAAGLTVGTAGPAGAKSVLLINGGQAKNVFWHVGSAAVINGAGGGVMTGTIIANSGITFSTAGNVVQTVLNGRAISLVSSVTMVNTTINTQ